MGRKAGLTRDDVLVAAAAVADEDGLEAATLGSVAAQLGIKPPSLYHWFDGAAGLRRALALRAAEALADDLGRACVGLAGADAVRALARAYRSFSRRHPGLYAALLPAPKRADDAELYDAMAQGVEVVAAVLAPWSLAPKQVVPVIRTLRSLLHGWASLERERGFGMPDDLERSFDVALEVFLAGLDGWSARARER